MFQVRRLSWRLFMSTAQSAYGDSNSGPDAWTGSWRRGCGSTRWSGFEILAMVLGFIVFWPIGLAILGYKIYQRKTGAADLQTVATAGWNQARSAMSGAASSPRPWSRGFSPGYTGNSAFDQWKSTEIARLEEERRKLEDAHREFADFLDNVRKAKDREEFDRFMNERRNRPSA
jgi:hypothetical protein